MFMRAVDLKFYFPVMSFVGEEHTLDDLNPFKFIETSFLAWNMI